MRTARIWFSLAALVFVVVLRPAEALAQACDPSVARIVAVHGEVGVSRGAQVTPIAARLDEVLCVGDRIQVGAFSRAALALPDETVVRLDQNTIVTIQPPRDEKKTWLDVLKGILHIISRDPRALAITTPFANAGIEGTEFVVAVGGDATTVIVYEGRVRVVNTAGAASAGAGESVLARAGQPPVLQQLVRPRDAVVWTLYYPPTSAGPLPAADAPVPAGATAEFYIGRAEQRLAAGQVAAAEADLASALALAPGSSEVLARQSVIALTQNDTVAATELADRAVAAAPDSAAARLAQSYARQAAFDLPGAIASLEDPAATHPGNALVRARLAELWLASGQVRRSEQYARAAVAADPNLSLAQTVLGFVSLARIELKEAEAAFSEAIRLQPDAPLPRLGLGLAKIRDGRLEAGREDIERAVILDPGNSLLRSYMGKAYFEEKRDELAASQFQLAKELDPKDPTPWFYDALRRQTVNQPVAALHDLNESIALNDNRAVYRSSLLLDDDAAARNAGISAIYNELGFGSLAVIQGTEGLADNFGDSSAHRLLSNAYADLPRYDISRVSEAFQAQLRQPLSVPPINLRETTDSLTTLKGIGSARVGVNEYNSLFNRDQLRIEADVTSATRDTWGDQFVVSGLEGNVGFALSQFHYETDGFSENNAARKNVYNGFLQTELSPTTTLQLDARRSDFRLGYTFADFDEFLAFPVEIDEKADAFRINGRHEMSPGSNWIWTLGYEDRRRDVDYFVDGSLVNRTDVDTYTGELQNLTRFGDFQFISGAGYITSHEKFPIFGGTLDTYDANTYVYSQWRASPSLDLIGGFSLDLFKRDYDFGLPDVERQHLSPKLGAVWTPIIGTTVRAAAMQSVRRPLIGDQTLEPTQVASFNQFFTGLEQFYGDPQGTISHRVGLSLEQTVTESLFIGIEGAIRRLEVPFVILDADRTWREKSARGYVYRSFSLPAGASPFAGWSATLSLAPDYEKLSRPKDFTGSEGIYDLETVIAPIGLSIFSPSGVSFRVATSYVDQDGRFSLDTFDPIVHEKDDAWITDVALQVRLPQRFGILSVGARNVFDTDIEVIETDPLNPRIARRRLVFANVSVTF